MILSTHRDQEQRMRVTQIIADLHVPDLKAAKGF